MRTKKIKYIATSEVYYESDLLPQPLHNHIPKWYRNIKSLSHQDQIDEMWSKRTINIKSCPSFLDIYKEGIVLLSPCDIRISWDNVDDHWTWRTPIDLFPDQDYKETITFHNDDQMKTFLPSTAKTRVVFKINLPLIVQPPKGYKIRMIPVPFSYNNDFRTIDGIFNPQFQPQVNMLFEYTSQKDEILIKQGTPLAVHIPYKKENYEIETEMYDAKKHRNYRFRNDLKNTGRFHSSYLRNHDHF